MITKKYLHSCLLIEDHGQKLLVDPGIFTFVDGRVKAADFGRVDAVLFTHTHDDHMDIPVLKEIVAVSKPRLITHRDAAVRLESESLGPVEILEAGQEININGLSIRAFQAPHEEIPTEPPYNQAYLVGGKLLITGDSFRIEGLKMCEILTLPTGGPWLNLPDALRFAKSLNPRIVFPVHDGIFTDFYCQRLNGLVKNSLEKSGIEFRQLKLGERLEV
ncbi:MBL fold metallo-hydrolase [bacterium]|nr:MAG: MBL fold metallo-hydrolase [bacterium]